ncbi:cell wall-binding protein [Desulfitobacterium hafniense]|uniref:Cell wall-binding protein n=1 Tax=Desulfitobacterium hafniense TaxID=49338 RepID=A0A0W1JQH2_DESHA|nr:cell wall-binding repeat-containing protein [Desulfitobacterium hafniense]KTE93829.1 cell wall-binding protein [Desulfitobacterium hafniense]
MNKTKKALASLAIAGMVLSMAPVSVFAADEDTRLAGADRYLTSIKIAEKAYASADTAVVAAGNPNNLVDALAAAPLAAQEDAPIYLTDKADMNDDVVKSMKALGVDKVIVVGAAASKAVVDELKAAGFSVEEVKGAGRVETAEAINKKLTAPAGTFVVGYDGVADAMSVASYAAANNYAIVVTNQNGVANGTVDADYIVGGTTRVKDIAGAKRLAGADRYDTNKQVIAELDFDFGKVYVGNGLTLADALVGSVLAAQTNSPIALTDGKTVKADIASNLDADSVVVALGGTAAVSNAVIDAVKNPPSTGEFKVESVKAAAANAIKVQFGKAPADASKVTFEVKRSTTPVTVTATWDGAVATLAGAQNFPAGDYTVTVKEGDKDLGTSNLKFEAQKTAKINITSTKLGVTSSSGIGYATYEVLDQYGNNITSSALANSLDFKSGVGDVSVKSKGIIEVKPAAGVNILAFSTVVITAYDTNSGVSTTATLATSTQIGTLSSFKFNGLKDADGKTVTTIDAGDSTSIYYADFTAVDISGNPTTSYELIKSGLVVKNTNELTTSADTYLKATIESDPKDSSKAVVKVQPKDLVSSTLSMDLPAVITAMTWTGEVSSLDITIAKSTVVDSFTLMVPSYDIAVGDTDKEIPFVAYDQKGNPVTSFDKLESNTDTKVSVSGATFKKNVDGSAALIFTNPNAKGPVVVTATTKTGKYTSVTINVQDRAVADQLALDSSVLVSAMQIDGATQKIGLGYDNAGLTVKDQYGRTMDLVAEPGNYKVVATSSSSNVGFKSGNIEAFGSKEIELLSGNAAGTSTVTFTLYNGTSVVDSKSLTISVIANDKIAGYTIASVEKPIYTAATSGAVSYDSTDITDAQKEYAAKPKVYGTTSTGAKVVLKPGTVTGAFVDSGSFVAKADTSGNKAQVVAKKFTDPAKSEGSTTLTVTVLDAYTQDTKAFTTTIKSSTASPAPASIEVEVDNAPATANGTTGISFSGGDTIEIASSYDFSSLNNLYITKFNAAGTANSEAPFIIYAKDQYGKKAQQFASLTVNAPANCKLSIDNTGRITYNASGVPGTVKVTAVTKNGLSKTIQIIVK